jgi:hypothetical protein
MEQKNQSSNEGHPEAGPDDSVFSRSSRPPFYNVSFAFVVGLCISVITWLFKSGAIELWDRHPGPVGGHEIGWFFSLLFGIPSGLCIGAFLMSYYLRWYEERHRDDQEDD